MTRELHEDLVAWETGEISYLELDLRHPGQGTRALTQLHERLAVLGREPTPDPAAGWARLSERLPEQVPMVPMVPMVPSLQARRARRIPRRLVAVLAATLLFGGTALAAPGTFRQGLDAVRGGVEWVLGTDDDPGRQSQQPGDPSPDEPDVAPSDQLDREGAGPSNGGADESGDQAEGPIGGNAGEPDAEDEGDEPDPDGDDGPSGGTDEGDDQPNGDPDEDSSDRDSDEDPDDNRDDPSDAADEDD